MNLFVYVSIILVCFAAWCGYLEAESEACEHKTCAGQERTEIILDVLYLPKCVCVPR